MGHFTTSVKNVNFFFFAWMCSNQWSLLSHSVDKKCWNTTNWETSLVPLKSGAQSAFICVITMPNFKFNSCVFKSIIMHFFIQKVVKNIDTTIYRHFTLLKMHTALQIFFWFLSSAQIRVWHRSKANKILHVSTRSFWYIQLYFDKYDSV